MKILWSQALKSHHGEILARARSKNLSDWQSGGCTAGVEFGPKHGEPMERSCRYKLSKCFHRKRFPSLKFWRFILLLLLVFIDRRFLDCQWEVIGSPLSKYWQTLDRGLSIIPESLPAEEHVRMVIFSIKHRVYSENSIRGRLPLFDIWSLLIKLAVSAKVWAVWRW